MSLLPNAGLIQGDSLGKAFNRWLVYYDNVQSPVTDDLIGRLCVVGLSDDRVLVKTIQRGNNNLFNLISNGPNEPQIDGVTIEWAALANALGRQRRQ